MTDCEDRVTAFAFANLEYKLYFYKYCPQDRDGTNVQTDNMIQEPPNGQPINCASACLLLRNWQPSDSTIVKRYTSSHQIPAREMHALSASPITVSKS